jgi:hypothetical protein
MGVGSSTYTVHTLIVLLTIALIADTFRLVWGYNWPSCHWRTQIQRPGPPGSGLDVKLMTLLCKKKYCYEI